MPFECRKTMLWGPGEDPLRLYGGDEVPAPIRASLLQQGHVAKVDAVAGKKWSDQPEDAQKAWADCNGQNFLHESRREKADGQKEVVESKAVVTVKQHPSQMFGEGNQLPERMIHRPLELEVADPARSEPLEVAGGEAKADEPAADKPVAPFGKKNKQRGRRSRR